MHEIQSINDTNVYRITRKIAEGGMGSVYEAIQVGAHGFEKKVAIKCLLEELCNDSRFIDMFIDEAKLVANLVHENIVQIYQLSKNEKGYFFVMEYVNGIALHEFIHYHNISDVYVPQELAVFIASRISRGLAYAHSRTDENKKNLNVVHRDICPNNILITTEGLPKLTDFGIAKAQHNIMPPNDECLMGKLSYMPPEQANRQGTDPRSDIYALGMVLFEMLTGEKSRNGETDNECLEMAVKGQVPWGALPSDLPEKLEEILRNCLKLNPENRYQNAEQLSRELEYFIYKDGYGPTVVTLEKYLKQEFPYLYK